MPKIKIMFWEEKETIRREALASREIEETTEQCDTSSFRFLGSSLARSRNLRRGLLRLGRFLFRSATKDANEDEGGKRAYAIGVISKARCRTGVIGIQRCMTFPLQFLADHCLQKKWTDQSIKKPCVAIPRTQADTATETHQTLSVLDSTQGNTHTLGDFLFFGISKKKGHGRGKIIEILFTVPL